MYTLKSRCSFNCRTAMTLLWVAMMVFAQLAWSQTYDITQSLRYPAGDNGSPQPTNLYVDRYTGDIFLADASTSRIVIYDSQRRFNFEFSTRSHVVSPRKVAVDAQGRIYVLGDTRTHTLAVFDYNGEFLNHLDLTAEDGSQLEPADFVLDNENKLYLLSLEPLRMNTYTSSGSAIEQFEILGDDEATRMSPVIGNFLIDRDRLLLPLPIAGTVAVMDLAGKLIRFVGYSGGGPGELSFPAACCPTDDGGYVVLDKHRHLLQFIGSDGLYKYEIGGAGLVEGWFFHPTALAKCHDGTLLVGQIHANRVQAVTPQVTPIVTGS